MGRAIVLLRHYTTAALGFSLAACGGGVPLFHGPHALSPGQTATGVGLSGTFTTGSMRETVTRARSTTPSAVDPIPPDVSTKYAGIAASIAPETAPYVGMRLGLPSDNEVGLSYTGRYLRLDGRHAFESGHWALSIGGGLSGLWGSGFRSEQDTPSQQLAATTSAFGGDVPILFGWQSDAGVVSLWGGARGAFQRIVGDSAGEGPSTSIGLNHWRVGGVAGLSFGFRHVHTMLELETAYNSVSGDFGLAHIKLSGVTLTPAGALRFTF
ncbi:MAG: hypothetical protein ABW133_21940 [Polyangiaceae bacterium]